MVYPVGDLLLLALAVGGITILPKEYRRFLVIATTAMAFNLTGDTFNLLQPDSKLGYICNAVAWPTSLLMLAVATWVQPVNVEVRPANAYNLNTEKTAGFMFPVLGALASMVGTRLGQRRAHGKGRSLLWPPRRFSWPGYGSSSPCARRRR